MIKHFSIVAATVAAMLFMFGPLAESAHAQAMAQISAPASGRPGKTVTVRIALQAPGTMVGFQADVVSAPLTLTAAQSLTSKLIASQGQRFIVYALDTTPLPTGDVADLTLSIPTDAPIGQTTVNLAGLVGSDGNGQAVELRSAGPATITILAKQDITGDGSVDVADVMAMLNQIFGMPSCTDDQNGDGVCDIRDLILVVKAIP